LGTPKKRILAGAVLLLLVGGVYLYSTLDVSHQTVRFRLGTLCASIYEYQRLTGQWPGSAADLAGTSMSLQMQYWQEEIRTGQVVVLWPQNFKPHSKDNADRILAYYTGGLISRFGRQWVCWGDLRTEYLPTAELETALRREQ